MIIFHNTNINIISEHTIFRKNYYFLVKYRKFKKYVKNFRNIQFLNYK